MTEETDIAEEKLRLTGKQMRLTDASVRLAMIKHKIGPDCMAAVKDLLDETIKLIDLEIDETHKKRESM